MKKIIFIVLSICLSTALFAGCEMDSKANDKMDVVSLRLAEMHNSGYPTTMADKKFAELVEERTNGKVKIIVYSDEQLGNETQVLRAVKEGTIDFARISAAEMVKYQPKVISVMMPYLYTSGEHMWKALDSDIGDEVLSSIDTEGFVGLAWYDAGARNFYADKEIKRLEDMSMLRIRIQENDLMYDLIEALGAQAYSIPQRDTHSAINDDIIDGAENNMSTYESLNQVQVAPYYMMDQHIRIPEMLVASGTVFETLPKEYQQIIRECAKETEAFQRERWEKREQTSLNAMEIKGAKITYLDDDARAEFVNACEPLYDTYAKDYADIIDRIKAIE